MSDTGSSQETWSKLLKISTSLRGSPSGMINSRVYVDTSVRGRGSSWEAKNDFFLFLLGNDHRARTKMKDWLLLLQALLSLASGLPRVESTAFGLADSHEGYERMNTSLQESFHSAYEMGWHVLGLCYNNYYVRERWNVLAVSVFIKSSQVTLRNKSCCISYFCDLWYFIIKQVLLKGVINHQPLPP